MGNLSRRLKKVRRLARECIYCNRKKGPWTVDHIIPRGWGARQSRNHPLWNLAIACQRCNRRKSKIESIMVNLCGLGRVEDTRDPRIYFEEMLRLFERREHPFNRSEHYGMAKMCIPHMKHAMATNKDLPREKVCLSANSAEES